VSRVPARIGADSQVVIVRRGGRSVGLLVGGLDAVLRFAPEQIVATPFGNGGDVKLVPHVIKAGGADGDGVLIQLVDSAYLFARLFEAGEPEAALADTL
jgi:chemotaxis signal transduction protein